MFDVSEITINRIPQSRISEVDFDNIEFGKVYSDHMFVADYRDGAWHAPRIEPYGPMMLSPANVTLHYAQSVFEGMKAFKSESGEVRLFRPLDNYHRINISAERMVLPQIPEEIFMGGLTQLIDLDRDWVPNKENTALYIRPFLFATDEYIGIRPSVSFKFMIITCPVGAYYSKPVKVKIEEHYTRAVAGGTGFAKSAGNYGNSLYPAVQAVKEGYNQLIWTDAKEHKYVEESGTMNVVFVIGDTLVTAPTDDTILKGITRDSVLTLARDMGMKVEERRLSVEELVGAARDGSLKEAFGTGTAATITSIEMIGFRGEDLYLPGDYSVADKMKVTMEQIKTAQIDDPHGWTYLV